MKLRNLIAIASMVLILLLCVTSVSASQQDSNLTVDDGASELEVNDVIEVNPNTDKLISDDSVKSIKTDNTSNIAKNAKTEKIAPNVLFGQGFIYKQNKYVKVKVYDIDQDTNKYIFYKNVNLTVKLKIGKKTYTYKVKTNYKGEAKVFNVKNLKVGTYKVTITTPDSKYRINEKDTIVIYGKTKNTITLTMKKTNYGIENRKKLNIGDTIYVFYEPRDAQYPKGVYAESYLTKDPLDGLSHTMVTKAKFFFKNKKTGKIVTKTAKLTEDKFHGWKPISVKPIDGYVPIKAKIWYLTR